MDNPKETNLSFDRPIDGEKLTEKLQDLYNFCECPLIYAEILKTGWMSMISSCPYSQKKWAEEQLLDVKTFIEAFGNGTA